MAEPSPSSLLHKEKGSQSKSLGMTGAQDRTGFDLLHILPPHAEVSFREARSNTLKSADSFVARDHLSS